MAEWWRDGQQVIAKPGTWFDAGTTAECLCAVISPGQDPEGVGCSLFRGLRRGVVDDETCRNDEFLALKESHAHD